RARPGGDRARPGRAPRGRDAAGARRLTRRRGRGGRLPRRRELRDGHDTRGRRRPLAQIRRVAAGVETSAMELALNSMRLPRAAEPATIPHVAANDCTDGELIRRTADGDRGAFDVLYRRYSRPVFGLALR